MRCVFDDKCRLLILKLEIFLAFETGGMKVVQELLRYFHSAISNDLPTAIISMSSVSEWMVA